MSIKYIAGEDLQAGQIAQINEEDGKFYASKSADPSAWVIMVSKDVKKDQVIKKEMKRD